MTFISFEVEADIGEWKFTDGTTIPCVKFALGLTTDGLNRPPVFMMDSQKYRYLSGWVHEHLETAAKTALQLGHKVIAVSGRDYISLYVLEPQPPTAEATE